MPHKLMVLGIFCCCAPGATADHWSFQPRTKPETPRFAESAQRAWVSTSVDAFVLARLNAKGLKPAPPAERRTLIRRVTFDLTGLPPTPKEIDAFVNDTAADAYERLVERLLASPHYGERWAQHWLDVVRYAESEGFEYDNYLPGMWRYRDYVIRSFNDDKPFDRFLTEQLAGDELKPGDADMQVAAGFHRLGPVRRNVGNQNVAFSRNEVLTERTDAVGMVFLGLTVGCARCHDHRFDDFSQEDYYRLQAFLAGTHEHNVILADAKTKADWDAATAPLQKEIGELKRQISTAKGADKERLQTQLKAVQAKLPPPLPTVCTVRDDDAERTPIHVLRRGMPEKKGKLVAPGLPNQIFPVGQAFQPDAEKRQAGKPDLPPRVALAKWLAHPDHPLTARVWVNRVWHYHFGQGLVATPNDFGVNGSGVSHPELLDHLANEFVHQGMKLKPLHRMIVLSNTYRQAGALVPSPFRGRGAGGEGAAMAKAKDPDNRLYWHFPRRRLSAEEIRDTMLAAAGQLNLKAGGPSVVVPLAKDLVDLLYDPAQWKVNPDIREHDRRSIYLIAKRNLRPPFGQAFDQPDLQTTCPRRESSTHALQALELMNGDLANRLAEAFARRLEQDAASDPARMVEQAFLLTTGRPPSAAERDRCIAFLRRQPAREFALAMFNLNAFLYVD